MTSPMHSPLQSPLQPVMRSPLEFRRRGGFDPAMLFASGEQGVWFDPSDFSTMFQDSAGTIPVTAVGQPVGLILDKSGNGHNASQATASARPMLDQDANGYYRLVFDGSNDILTTSIIDFTGTNKMTAFAGVGSSGGMIYELSSDAGAYAGGCGLQYNFVSNAFTGIVNGGIGTLTSTNGLYPPDIFVVVTQQIDISLYPSSYQTLRVNGSPTVMSGANPGSGNFGNYALNIGSRAGNYRLDGPLYQFILRGDATTQDTAIATEKYITGKMIEPELVTAESLGATGGPAINAAPLITAALSDLGVSGVLLGELTHYFEGSIVVPSGKSLIGVSPELTWLKKVPVTLGVQASPVQCINFVNDTNGGVAKNFSIDVQRSGFGGTLNDRASGLSISCTTGVNGKNTRISGVNVYNATGYAHYDSVAGTGTLRGIVRQDCKAYNSQVCFESTGDVEVTTVDSYANVDATTVWDGGVYIPCETIYHEYGNIFHVNRIRAIGYGQAGAGMNPITVGADIRQITYTDADIEITNAVPALVATGQGGYVIQQITLNNCRFVSANGNGALLTNCTATINGGEYIGGNLSDNGGGNGAGIGVSTGTIAALYAPEVTGKANTLGAATAFGLLVDGTGDASWYGEGSITAVGPSGMMTPYSGAITFYGTPVLSPA